MAMTDELRAAAERHLYEIVIGPIDDAMDEFKASDRKEWLEEAGWQNVSIRWIDTEHPADDDDPVTEEWLESQNLLETQIIGIHERPTFVRYIRFVYRIFGVGDSGCVALIQSMCGTKEIEIRLNTRRQVRDLIRALKGGE